MSTKAEGLTAAAIALRKRAQERTKTGSDLACQVLAGEGCVVGSRLRAVLRKIEMRRPAHIDLETAIAAACVDLFPDRESIGSSSAFAALRALHDLRLLRHEGTIKTIADAIEFYRK